MATSRKWMIAGCIALACGSASAVHSAEPLSPAQTTALIQKLHGEQYAVRDQALLDLVDAGPAALEALLRASTSADLELAWRAGEAVQMVCRSADAYAPAIHKELARLAKLADKRVAKLASQHLQKWSLYRHEYAAAELTLLGARVGDGGSNVSWEHTGAAGFIVADGAGFPIGGIAEVMPAIAEVDFDDKPEEAAPAIEKIPLFGGLFRAIGRVAGEMHAADEARAAALTEVVEKRMAAELKRLEGFEDLKDVDVIESPPDGAPMAEEEEEALVEEVVDAMDIDVDGPVELGGAMFGGMVLDGFSVDAPVYNSSAVAPGTVVFDKSWRGADDGLRYLADLRGFHTVSFRQAAVTDAALRHVASMKSLQNLEIRGTLISGAALQKLHQSRPHLSISAIGPSMLGVTGSDKGQGVIVDGVLGETGARRAGIHTGDIIRALNEIPIRNFNDLTLALFDKQPGETVTVSYLRGGQQQQTKVVLSERSQAAATTRSAPVQYLVEPGFRMMPAPPLPGGFFMIDR